MSNLLLRRHNVLIVGEVEQPVETYNINLFGDPRDPGMITDTIYGVSKIPYDLPILSNVFNEIEKQLYTFQYWALNGTEVVPGMSLTEDIQLDAVWNVEIILGYINVGDKVGDIYFNENADWDTFLANLDYDVDGFCALLYWYGSFTAVNLDTYTGGMLSGYCIAATTSGSDELNFIVYSTVTFDFSAYYFWAVAEKKGFQKDTYFDYSDVGYEYRFVYNTILGYISNEPF